MLPPPPGRYASGEVRDDDIGYAANIELPGDIAGTIEIHQKHVDSDSGTDEEENSPAKSNAKKRYQYFFYSSLIFVSNDLFVDISLNMCGI